MNFIDKNLPEQQKRKAQKSMFEKARGDYSELLDESERQIHDAHPNIMLDPQAMQLAKDDLEFQQWLASCPRKFQ